MRSGNSDLAQYLPLKIGEVVVVLFGARQLKWVATLIAFESSGPGSVPEASISADRRYDIVARTDFWNASVSWDEQLGATVAVNASVFRLNET